jgi:hypothetical protein
VPAVVASGYGYATFGTMALAPMVAVLLASTVLVLPVPGVR